MHKLTIRTQCKNNTTIIENEFIDTYMPRANGEYIKVYLYLLRHMHSQNQNITLAHIADALDNTERDILRALAYWEKNGLLIISYNEAGNISGIDIATISVDNVGSAPNTQIPTPNTTPSVSTSGSTSSSSTSSTTKLSASKSRKEFKQLLFMTEQYLEKTLSKSDVDMITYFYDTLHFPIALIEFLIEYCVENGHYSMHYIQSVALTWSDLNITTVEAAKSQISTYNKDYYTVLKAYGITGRLPVSSEKSFINKWIKELGFSMELILEACSRTIAKIHQPSFEYTDSILSNWSNKNIHYLTDLDKLDKEYHEQQSKKSSKTINIEKSRGAKNSFNNFQPRTYDLESLEMQLLNAK